MKYATSHRRHGFTMTEILIVVVLGSVVLGAFYQVLRYQQRIYRQHRATVYRHDALRLAGSVLAADLMEANGGGGDIASMTADSVSLRSYTGFAIVCAADSVNQTVALFDLEGRITDTTGDSLLIYHRGGWLVRALTALNPSIASSLDCPYGAGPSAEVRAQLDASIAGIPVGAPVRSFHRYMYRLEEEKGFWWLARDDGSDSEILAGPFTEAVGLAFTYLDTNGQPTSDPADVARVDVTLVAEGGRTSERTDTLTSSVRPRNQ